MIVCNKCFNTKENCYCINAWFVEIDDNIYPVIKKLNYLGYKTLFCCEGHIGDNISMQAYIVFDCDKNIKMFDELPNGWYYEYYNYKKEKRYKYNIIRSVIPKSNKMQKLTIEQQQKIIDFNIHNLIEWVKTLKERQG